LDVCSERDIYARFPVSLTILKIVTPSFKNHNPHKENCYLGGVQGGEELATRMNSLDWLSLALVIIGGLNWGLVGAFEFDLVAAIFGEMTIISRIIYVLVGLAALYMLYFATRVGSDTRADETRTTRK
jgi:uncharacterized membrane protein YuzA (DUF378 family)